VESIEDFDEDQDLNKMIPKHKTASNDIGNSEKLISKSEKASSKRPRNEDKMSTRSSPITKKDRKNEENDYNSSKKSKKTVYRKEEGLPEEGTVLKGNHFGLRSKVGQPPERSHSSRRIKSANGNIVSTFIKSNDEDLLQEEQEEEEKPLKLKKLLKRAMNSKDSDNENGND